MNKIESLPTRQKTETKEVRYITKNHLVGESSLTIKDGQVITKNSLILTLEELKALIKHYEELT